MSMLERMPGAALALAAAGVVSAAAWWLATNKPTAPKADKPPAAATVTEVVKEDDLRRVVVSADAVKNIGLTVGTVEVKDVRRTRVYGGEVAIPVGRTILVAAPLGGTLDAPTGGKMPTAGQTVRAGDVVVRLSPLLSPDAAITMKANLATAEGLVKTAKKRLDAAEIALTRAKSAEATSGSKGTREAAQGAHDVAVEEWNAATANRDVLSKAVGEIEKGTSSPIPIVAPHSGILRTISAVPGQTVPNGAALFEVLDLSTVWVRVPLPVGDFESVDRTAKAVVGKLSAPPDAALATAEPTAAPPSANLLAGTVDAFYAMPNSGGALIPGQRVGVTIPLADPKEKSLTVPWSAVVFDVNGGNWVFEETAPRTFVRKRVVVKCTDPGSPATAVLEADTAPKAGTKIAITGVQQLFGAETGFVK